MSRWKPLRAPLTFLPSCALAMWLPARKAGGWPPSGYRGSAPANSKSGSWSWKRPVGAGEIVLATVEPVAEAAAIAVSGGRHGMALVGRWLRLADRRCG